MKKKQKRSRRGLIIIAIVAFVLVALSIFLPNYLILDSKVIDARIRVYDGVGIDVTNESLSFGGIMPGGSSMRTIMIESNRDFDMVLEVMPLGEMKKFIKREKYTIKKGIGYELDLSASAPLDIPFGDYEGKIKFVLYRKIL